MSKEGQVINRDELYSYLKQYFGEKDYAIGLHGISSYNLSSRYNIQE